MLAPATVLQDRYQIVRMIGHGGMGAVYEAVDLRLGNSVALKQTLFSDEELSWAFEREARLLGGLSHPALPQVTDHFVEGGGQFLVMEFIPGDDLAGQLKRRGRPFEPDQVSEWAYQLLDALDYLHSHRPPIIHRDIKPHNLKMRAGGRIVLLDFGLAKGQPQLLDRGTVSSVFGYTLNYAPLEQIEHKGADARSDLYSAGATLFQLMTAVVPPGSLSRAAAIVGGEGDPLPPASVMNPRVSPAIAQVISKAMALRAENRFDSAADMRRAFGEASWRPSTGHWVFGKIATAASSTGSVSEDTAPKIERSVDVYEVPTQPLMMFERNAALQTVPNGPRPEPQSPKSSPVIRSRWIWSVAAVLTFLIFLTVFWSARLGESDPLPPTRLVDRQNPPPPGPQSPGFVVPSPPGPVYQTDRPTVLAPVWNQNGTMTLYWRSVPGAVRYRLESANENRSMVRTLTESDQNSFTIRSPGSGAVRYVRLTAILEDGRTIVGLWFLIPKERHKE